MWYEEPVDGETHYECTEDGRLRYDEEQGHALLALLLSLVIYALFLVLVFIELPLSSPEEHGLIPRGNDLLDHLPRRREPARVVSLPAPQGVPSSAAQPPAKTQIKKLPPATNKSIKSTVPLVPTPAPLTPTAAPAESAPISEPSMPATIKTPENNERHGGVDVHPASTVPTDSPLPSRRRHASWSRQQTPEHVLPPTTTSKTYESGMDAFSHLEEISAQQVTRFPACSGDENGEPTYGSPIGQDGQVSPKRMARNMEFELFVTRLVHNVCDASRQRPLRLANATISMHVIAVSLTITRDRRITKIAFLRPSPHQMINHYLEGIMQTTTAPQLPASWRSDELTMPLQIHIHSVPERAEIWLVPIEGT